MTTVADVMTKRPITVHPKTSVADALWLSADQGVDHLLVCDRDIQGVVCARCDLQPAESDCDVAEYIARELPSIDPGESLTTAAERMCAAGVGALFVRSAMNLVGIVTRGDLARANVSEEDCDSRFFCAACGAHAHVTQDPRCELVAFCADCWDRARPPEFDVDIGGSG